jgi:hypothetical protein
MTVPFVDIAEYAFQAGFRGDAHAIIVALTVPESSRNPTAHNGDDPHKGSFGLTQINGVHLNPGGVLEGWTIEDLYDPAKNLKAAFMVWKQNGESFKPWGAYTSNLHLASLDAARAAMDGAARLRQANARVAQFKAERDRILVAHDALKITVELLKQKIADARQALA